MVKNKKTASSRDTETDGQYFLKIVLYIVLGSIWLKFAEPIVVGSFVLNGLPVGLLIGLLAASHDRLRVDRKIEYALLIVVTIVSYFLPSGIVI